MKMKMKMKLKMPESDRRPTKPSNVFTQCPACDSPNIFSNKGDVFCTYCDWNSILLRSDSQFDCMNLFEPGMSSIQCVEERTIAESIEHKECFEEYLNFLDGFDAA